MHSLLMSAPMVLAYGKGQKTQTRRIIRDQFHGCLTGDCPHDSQAQCDAAILKMAKLKPGTPFYLRETYAPCVRIDGDFPDDRFYKDIRGIEKKTTAEYVIYRADGGAEFSDDGGGLLMRKDGSAGSLWKSPLLMPEWAARYFPTCTGVSAERLQDISEADAIAEGVDWKSCPTNESAQSMVMGWGVRKIDYIGGYRRLWNSINLPPKPVYGPGKVIVGYRSFPWNIEDFEAAYGQDSVYQKTDHGDQRIYGKTPATRKPISVIPNPWVWRIQFTGKAK